MFYRVIFLLSNYGGESSGFSRFSVFRTKLILTVAVSGARDNAALLTSGYDSLTKLNISMQFTMPSLFSPYLLPGVTSKPFIIHLPDVQKHCAVDAMYSESLTFCLMLVVCLLQTMFLKIIAVKALDHWANIFSWHWHFYLLRL